MIHFIAQLERADHVEQQTSLLSSLRLLFQFGVFGYHRNNEKQLKRDALKDHIFGKNNLPLLRIVTNESGEKEKLVNSLMKVINNRNFQGGLQSLV